MDHVIDKLAVSERRAYRTLGQRRSTQRKLPCTHVDEDGLTSTIIALACQYGRYGYRRIHWLLCQQGWHVSLKRPSRRCKHRLPGNGEAHLAA